MPLVQKSIEINAPVETVFDFIANQPERMPDWWQAIKLQERVTPPPTRIGSVSRYVYKMLGISLKGEHQVAEMTENRRLQVKTLSGLESAFTFDFEPLNNRTRLTVNVNYELPGAIIGQFIDKLAIEMQNERHLEVGLQNLKDIMESKQAI